MDIFNNKKEKNVTYIVFAIYMMLLIWLVVFKFAFRLEDIPRLQGINLMPFQYGLQNSFHRREVIYNLLVFIPAGFYFTAFLRRKFLLAGVMVTALISLVFEMIQWVFAIGASDITDVIMNTLGGLCGMLLFLIMGMIFRKRRMRMANIVGIVIEVTGIAAVLMTSSLF